MQLLSVYSSHIDQIGYDPASRELTVHYRNGKRGVYSNVPPETWEKVSPSNNPSVGQAIHAHVRGRFAFTYLKQDDND